MEATKGRNSVKNEIGLLASRIRAAATISQKDHQALNAKQELFCQEIAKGSLKYEAARKAGYIGSEKVLSVTAAKLTGLSKVKLRIVELQSASAAEVKLTRDKHMLTLAELRDRATSQKQYAAAIRAEELRGKIAGLHREDDEQQRAIADRVAKLPVDAQLSLVRAALQRIQTMTGTHIEIKIDRPIKDEEIVPKAPEPVFENKHESDALDEGFASIGLDTRRKED